MIDFKAKAKAFGLHAATSALLAMCVIGLLFLWYPFPYVEISGGIVLFSLVVAVDLVCGPLLTFVVYDQRKPKPELIRDIVCVVVIQLSALGYGMYSVFIARPVYLVFEVDRFVVICSVDIDQNELAKAGKEFSTLSLTGPRLIAAKKPASDEADFLMYLKLAAQGFDISKQPKYWVAYDEMRGMVLDRAKNLEDLARVKQQYLPKIEQVLKEKSLSMSGIKYLPLQARETSDWIVLVDGKSAEPVGYVHVDGF